MEYSSINRLIVADNTFDKILYFFKKETVSKLEHIVGIYNELTINIILDVENVELFSLTLVYLSPHPDVWQEETWHGW